MQPGRTEAYEVQCELRAPPDLIQVGCTEALEVAEEKAVRDAWHGIACVIAPLAAPAAAPDLGRLVQRADGLFEARVRNGP